MLPLAIFAFLSGAVLAMRWNVLVLIPTSLLLATGALVSGLVNWIGAKALGLDLLMVLVAHQVGYMFGAVVGDYLAHGAKQLVNVVVRARH